MFKNVWKLVLGMAVAVAWPLCADARTWTASHQFPVGDPRDQELRILARDVAKAGLDIKIFPAASLLRPRDQWNGLQNGSVDLVFTPADYLVEQFPQLAALSLPGLIRTHAQAVKIGASAPMRELRRQIEAEGVMILADSWVAGAIGGRGKCILTPDDTRGLRARTIGRYMADCWTAAGAIPVPAPTTSDMLATLLDNDLIDIANTSVTTMLMLRMQRKFTCLTIPGEAGALWYLWEPILISKRRFEALDEPRRQALLAAGARAQESMAATHSQIERRLAGDFLASGVEVVSMDADSLAAWHKLARRTAWRLYREQVPGGADLLDKLQAVE
ncbi:MAG: TRAP transporter substrate-binding protein DctP [Phaeospirillum sp.]|nr:TRAP transporter substrate-binding protein DctP [Phaeospirillum sp.]